MKNNYDSIAGYYDVLSRMVFFRAQVKAQIDQLHAIPANSTVLIAGGGTGWILEEIAKIHPSGLTITYIEISSKMLDLSKKREVKSNAVTFIHSAMEDFKTNFSYDVLITAFFFDNFSADHVEIVFNQLNKLLKKDGIWLFADFYYTRQSGKRWQWLLLQTMYLFFSKISSVEAKSLVNTEHLFREKDYLSLKEAFYYSGFIKTIIYQKMT
ncbi:ubiquinone/menaquinone biosynthesis C-methylase UbiE [Pedobacter cryoconitis]|uniref:Ubiquinone/menaquinone biosynthesis C-methylase UbiE n=1 Tax=Pedobacter cryoconitis TaxID=188932 RepID=A0A7W8ZPK9_9SPHI|nr:class I SAM-dependent methyltransferase [Pedobacter cryoconitis]MBB5637857.1 ubiquinone/menaquinone biosynthesis C-methylase UbiE [Pedobacter cryoconitis]